MYLKKTLRTINFTIFLNIPILDLRLVSTLKIVGIFNFLAKKKFLDIINYSTQKKELLHNFFYLNNFLNF